MLDRFRFSITAYAFFTMILVGGGGILNPVEAQPAPPSSLSVEDFVSVPDGETYAEENESSGFVVQQANVTEQGDGVGHVRPVPPASILRPVGSNTRPIAESARVPVRESSLQSESSSDGVPKWAYVAGGATIVAGGILAAVLLTGDSSSGSEGATLPPGRPTQ